MVNKASPPSVASPLWPMQAAQAAAEYGIDAWQRSILTLDVLRERGNQYLEHTKSGKPPVLVFDYDTVLDAREFPKPANYALVRIKPDASHAKTDAKKRRICSFRPSCRSNSLITAGTAEHSTTAYVPSRCLRMS